MLVYHIAFTVLYHNSNLAEFKKPFTCSIYNDEAIESFSFYE